LKIGSVNFEHFSWILKKLALREAVGKAESFGTPSLASLTPMLKNLREV
jgi:hypothetical protein